MWGPFYKLKLQIIEDEAENLPNWNQLKRKKINENFQTIKSTKKS